jgi:hypothetical protein
MNQKPKPEDFPSFDSSFIISKPTWRFPVADSTLATPHGHCKRPPSDSRRAVRLLPDFGQNSTFSHFSQPFQCNSVIILMYGESIAFIERLDPDGGHAR